MNSPSWWHKAESELDGLVSSFSDNIKTKIDELKPSTIVCRKNPYLFCLRATDDTERYAEAILDAYLSSSEETMFGTLAEGCAVVISKYGRNGMKSTAEGIDIEYSRRKNQRTIVQVKSGKNWGNSSQRKKMLDYFTKARRILQQGGSVNVRCIEGICYGPASTRDRGNHTICVGSDFWEEISGWDGVYMALLDVFSRHAQNGLLDIKSKARNTIVNHLNENGIVSGNTINWTALLKHVNTK